MLIVNGAPESNFLIDSVVRQQFKGPMALIRLRVGISFVSMNKLLEISGSFMLGFRQSGFSNN